MSDHQQPDEPCVEREHLHVGQCWRAGRAAGVEEERASVRAAVDQLAAFFASNGYDEHNLRRLLTASTTPRPALDHGDQPA